MSDLFDEGAVERERQDKIAARKKKYEDFARDFLGRASDVVSSWPVYRHADGMVRCGMLECDMAIDREGSVEAIRFHLYQVHRESIGEQESGIWGENQALGSSGRDYPFVGNSGFGY